MQSKPTKETMIAVMRRIHARDGHVSKRAIKEETGWDPNYWFDKGYSGACEEANVKRGAKVGVETNLRVADEDTAVRFAQATRDCGRIPSIKQFRALAQMGMQTITRGEKWDNAKQRLIRIYLDLPAQRRLGEPIDAILRGELARLNGDDGGLTATMQARSSGTGQAIKMPAAYVSHVGELRDRGEEEKRQLVAQFFHEVLGYRRSRVRSEHEHNDVRVHDRRGAPWLVVEVKARLDTQRDLRIARRQGFDYAHRHGMRYVVISDGDLYEIYDRYASQRLRYDEMRQGAFRISALRLRDSDLLSVLATEK